MSVVSRTLASLVVHAGLLAVLTARGLLAQFSPQETPAEYQQAVDEAREIGTYLFTRYSLETAARQFLEAEGVSDPRVQGSALGVDAGKLVARFMGVQQSGLEVVADAGVPKLPAGLPESFEHADESASESAPWRERLIVWRATDEPEAPWWTDERFRGQFPTDYPNDLPVVFPPDEGDDRFEIMWVQVFAYDAERDRFLGHLLNQPHFLESVAQGDHVVFGYDEVLQKGLARHDGGNYEVLTVPPSALNGSLSELYQGVLHQRRSKDGNVGDEIQACIETLEEVVRDQADSLAPHYRYLAHYTLGRCLADLYETDRAIAQFEKALSLQPDALDPNMALLAELSIKVVENKESKALEKRYLDQLALVRDRYGAYPRVAQVLSMIFDRKNGGDLSVLTAAEIARRERVGFGAIRWRMP